MWLVDRQDRADRTASRFFTRKLEDEDLEVPDDELWAQYERVKRNAKVNRKVDCEETVSDCDLLLMRC